jgi:hypothetical protein
MSDVKSEVIVCVPYPYLCQVEALVAHSQLKIGAQNLNVNASGAFTGEVSADMLKDFGAEYVKIVASAHCPMQLALFQQQSHRSRRIGFYALNAQQQHTQHQSL